MTSVQQHEQAIVVTRVVDASPERAFAMLADPDRHPDLDASGMVRGSDTHTILTEVGNVFTMRMHQDDRGDYLVDNTVVLYERDAAIGWAPARPGGPVGGQTWVYRFVPEGDGTRVSLTYDWSRVTDEALRARVPLVSAEQLEQSLDLLADALS